MTAAERLLSLSKLSGVTAAAMLLAIGTGGTAGEALVNYSKLDTATASEHILTDRAVVFEPKIKPSVVGGADDHGGSGFIKKDHGWVRLTKTAVVGISPFAASTFVRCAADVGLGQSACIVNPIATKASLSQAIDSQSVLVQGYNQTVFASVNGTGNYCQASVGAKDCRAEWLDFDELVAIVEAMDGR